MSGLPIRIRCPSILPAPRPPPPTPRPLVYAARTQRASSPSVGFLPYMSIPTR